MTYTSYTDAFLFEMPKTDLHLHLDGSLRLETLIEAAQKMNVSLPSFTKEGLQELVFKTHYQNLAEYLHGFQYTCAVLTDLEVLEQASYELAIDNQKENVCYIEVRFAPQLFMNHATHLTMKNIFQAIDRGLKKAQHEYNNGPAVKEQGRPEFHYGMIACAMRKFSSTFSPYYNDFCQALQFSTPMDMYAEAALQLVRGIIPLRDDLGLPIVGIDLAGMEEGHPPKKFREAYQLAHQHFFHKTVHAGEAYGAESVFQAITDLYADRIGHGYNLFIPEKILDPKIKSRELFTQKLISYIADKRITIEVCLTSNMQTNPDIHSVSDHKFADMLNSRAAVSLCTDNRLVSHTTVTNEYLLATQHFNLPYKRLKDIVAYGFKKSFFPGPYVEKRSYAKKAMEYFEVVAKKHDIISK
jgi:adenosine deaminase